MLGIRTLKLAARTTRTRVVMPMLAKRQDRTFHSATTVRCESAEKPVEEDPGEPKPSLDYDQLKPHLDFKSFKENRYKHTMNIEKRNAKKYADLDKVIDLWEDHKTLKHEIDNLRKERNEKSKLINKAEDADTKADLIDDCKKLKEEIAMKEIESVQVWEELLSAGDKIPNWTHKESPIGPEENARAVSYNGKKPKMKFTPQDHVDIMMKHDMVDFKAGAQATGSKFSYLKNGGAFLELALVNWAMAEAVKKGFTPVLTPDLVHTKVAEACGFKPRSKASQNYLVEGKDDLVLAGTAEIPLAGMYINKVIEAKDLPIKLVGFGHAFRRETGKKQLKRKGMTNRGLYRVHQFSKVELFVICKEEESEKWHQQLLDMEGDMMKQLDVHYRVLEMPSEELGKSMYRKFDIEAWMPGRDNYGEVTSCANCLDHQARRLNIRYLDGDNKPKFAHTLNATGVATPRMMLTILENYQDAKGNVKIPAPIEPYYFGPKLEE